MQTNSLPSTRILSVDILRGIVIVIMGLDHVRDFVAPTLFLPEDITQTTPEWFVTRWITHFCAPVFVFLAGTSAFLYGQKVDKSTLRKFLWSRGIWLIFIELIVVHFAWTFDFNFWFLQVIWVIGVSMIILAFLTYLSRGFMIGFTLVLLLGHNALDGIQIDSFWWDLLHVQNWYIPFGNTFLAIVYPIIPWPAVMTLGYLMGELFVQTESERKRKLVLYGSTTIVAFILLRLINMYGDMHPWSPSDRGAIYTFLDFFNTTKYPPSLLFLAMTLGPAVAFLPKLEKWTGAVGQFFLVFGRVPFFYYIMHLFVAHLMGIVFNGIVYDYWGVLTFANPNNWPENYSANLWMVYVCWIFLTIIMYFLCKWFMGVKKRRSEWWLKYL
jgi:uncharacterized membrane protein